MRADARELLEANGVRPPDPAIEARSLSGGNQQKVVLARELAREASVLVTAQPTRGLDLVAARGVREALRRECREGRALLVISSDLDELRALTDRIAVIYRGRIVETLDVSDASDERLGALMTGVAEGGQE